MTVVAADYASGYDELRRAHGPGLLTEPFPDGEIELAYSSAFAK